MKTKKILLKTLETLENNHKYLKAKAAEAFENGTLLELKIEAEENPINPRDRTFFENLGTLVCNHRRYELGDEIELSIKDCESWQEAREKIESYHEGDDLLILPVYLLDHSGLAMSTTPFNCSWDSGQVGFIYAKKGVEDLTNQQLENQLRNEVQYYSAYLEGDVYEWQIKNTITGEFLDAGHGYTQHSEAESDGNAALKAFIE